MLTLQRNRKQRCNAGFFHTFANRNINANDLLLCIMRANQANVAAKREDFSLIITLEMLEIDSCHRVGLLWQICSLVSPSTKPSRHLAVFLTRLSKLGESLANTFFQAPNSFTHLGLGLPKSVLKALQKVMVLATKRSTTK